MTSRRPTLIAIDHDDYHAEYVGRTPDGRQFFLTTPFAHGTVAGNDGGEFVALYLFDPAGKLVDAQIDAFGPRGSLDHGEREHAIQERLDGLGDVTFGRIEVEPFEVQRFGLAFGLIARFAEDMWWVELLPGNYMAFAEPWDSGSYDT